jgi:hypothetical protein
MTKVRLNHMREIEDGVSWINIGPPNTQSIADSTELFVRLVCDAP